LRRIKGRRLPSRIFSDVPEHVADNQGKREGGHQHQEF
jgi:hypothetical protein